MATLLHRREGTEGTGFELGECNCDKLETVFVGNRFSDYIAAEEFIYVAKHSHLCSCGFKWWHSREQVEEHHDNHAHECPKCGKVVVDVHGWDDPTDKVKSHHVHHDHMITQ